MREIKFRVWDKEDKIMSVASLKELIGGIGWEYGIDPNVQCFTHEDIEIMQFTGMYDRRLREIWEGDIVEFPYLNDDHEWKTVRDVVRYCDEDAIWDPILGLAMKDIFVIGNIYENPELVVNKGELSGSGKRKHSPTSH